MTPCVQSHCSLLSWILCNDRRISENP